MKKNYLKRGTSVILSVAMISVFYGCGNKKETVTENDKLEVTVFSTQLSDFAQNPDTPIARMIEEKFNIVIKPIAADGNTWEEKLNTLLASGQIPDIFTSLGPVSRTYQFNTWIRDGFMLNLSEYVNENDYPEFSKALKRFDWLKGLEQGSHYCIPVATYFEDYEAVSNMANLVRQDWMENLGIKQPTNIDEYYEMLRAFTYDDPDGNGKDDTYGITSSGGVYRFVPIYNMFDVSLDRFRNVDGEWIPEVITDDMKECIKFLKKLYDEKILDPDFIINTEAQGTENFLSGKAGSLYSSASVSWYNGFCTKFANIYPDKDPSSLIDYMDVVEGKNGKRVDGVSNFWGVSSINGQLEETKIKRILEMYEYFMSEEGMEMFRYGVEGEEYKVEDGKKVSIIPNDSNGKPQELSKYDGAAKLQSLFTSDGGFVNSVENAQNPEAIDGIEKYMNLAKADPLAAVIIDDDVFSSSQIADLSDYAAEQIAKMIMNSTDIDADFDKFVSEWKSMGGNDYIKYKNEAAKEAGI